MNDFIELRYIIVTIIKWWWLFILTMLLAALLAFALTPAEKQLYRATTTLLVGQSIQSTKPSVSEISYDEKLALTYANIAKRQPILQGVVEALGLKENWLALKDRLSVQTIPQTQLLEISVLADSEQMARAEADEVARQLMLIRTSLLQKPEDSETQQQIQQRLTDIQSKINVGRSRISAMEGKLISAVTVAQIQEIQNNIDSLEKLITQWETNATQLLIALESTKAPNNLSVIEAAQITTVANAYQVYVNMLIAGVLGLGLALSFVFLREYLDDTVKSAEDVEHRLGLVTLGEISRIKSKNVQEQLMQKQSVFSKASEEYRLLRSKIQFLVSDWSSKVIMVTSPTPSEQQSIMVANLGVVLAQAGLRTIIVDTDLRQPMQHKIFQLSNQQGLSELLLSPTLEFDGHIQMTGVTNLRVIWVPHACAKFLIA
jgi:non-specific protein-tyrosine kinase